MRQKIPYFEDKDNGLRPGLPNVQRNTVMVILWNPQTAEVGCLDWGKFGWKTFVVGGVEEETPYDAAIREVAEETGYIDIEFLVELGKLRAGYFATHKGENRIARVTGYLFKLKSEERIIVGSGESHLHIFKWIPWKEVSSFLTPSSNKYLWGKARPYLTSLA